MFNRKGPFWSMVLSCSVHVFFLQAFAFNRTQLDHSPFQANKHFIHLKILPSHAFSPSYLNKWPITKLRCQHCANMFCLHKQILCTMYPRCSNHCNKLLDVTVHCQSLDVSHGCRWTEPPKESKTLHRGRLRSGAGRLRRRCGGIWMGLVYGDGRRDWGDEDFCL